MRLNRMLYHGNQYSPYVFSHPENPYFVIKVNQVISVRLLITTAFSFTFTIGGIYDELKKMVR